MTESENTLRLYCKCGGACVVTAPPRVRTEVKRIFLREHDGKGHGLCDASACQAARLQKEQMTLGLEYSD